MPPQDDQLIVHADDREEWSEKDRAEAYVSSRELIIKIAAQDDMSDEEMHNLDRLTLIVVEVVEHLTVYEVMVLHTLLGALTHRARQEAARDIELMESDLPDAA